MKYCGIFPSQTHSQARTHSWVSGCLYRNQADICSGEGRGGGERLTTLWAIDVTQEPSSERKQKLKGII